MVFNWFRRQQEKITGNQSPEAPSVSEAATPAAAEEATAEPAASDDVADPATEPGTNADEMLQWAKAAYANIQKQEAQPTESTESVVAPEPPESSAQSTAAPVESASTSTVEQVPSKPEVPEVPELVVPELVTPELEPELEAIKVEPETTIEAAEVIDPAAIDTGSEIADQVKTDPKVVVSQPQAIEPELGSPGEASEATETATVTEPEIEPEAIAPPHEPARPEPPAPTLAPPPESIALPEKPKAMPVATPQAKPQTPAVDFDEGFLWSAEVLAAQGRRPEDISSEEIIWLKQLRQGLTKTRMTMVNRLKAAVGQGPLDQKAIDDLEALLLQADVGVLATDQIISALQEKLEIEDLPAEEAIAYLKQLLRDMLDAPTKGKTRKNTPSLEPERNQLNIWLITGVNGAGKTTTIGKIAHLAMRSGYKTIIAAADTFRAAAVEQVKVWGDRAGVEVIANPGQNTDPAAVVFDGISAAQSRNCELLLVDTAGRLQNKKNLMAELSKIRRVVDKKASGAKIESLLVLDSTLGQNGLRQAEIFSQSAGVSGVVLTKLDGSAKGGVALAVVQQLKLPIRFIGAGEGIEDLRPFSSYEFVEALLSN
jgi:fused signal recognition particle receptor